LEVLFSRNSSSELLIVENRAAVAGPEAAGDDDWR
jgi:hypothetical protein